MKPNRGIATFLGIQIARNHILRNLDARSNVDSLVPNATLGYWLKIQLKKVFMGKKKTINVFITFFISHKSNVKIFLK